MCQAIKKWVPGGGYNLSSVAGAPRGVEQRVGGQPHRWNLALCSFEGGKG